MTAKGCGAFGGAKRLSRRRLRILSYHGVDDSVDDGLNFDGFFVSSAMFRKQMELLKNYRVVGLDDVLKMHTWPDHAVAITFDDGYKNNVEVAAPILREYGYPATFFVTTDYVAGRAYPWWFRLRRVVRGSSAGPLENPLKNMDYVAREEALSQMGVTEGSADDLPAMMDWGDVTKLQTMGFAVGGHTASHVSFAHESDELIRREVADSLRELRQHGLAPVTCYSYPYGGAVNVRAVHDLLREAGITAAVTDIGGLNGKDADRFMLRRLSISDNHRGLIFEAMLSGMMEPVYRMRARI